MIFGKDTIFFLLSYICRKKVINKNQWIVGSAVLALHTTWWRLYEGGGFTKVRAGDAFANSHKYFCGHTPPLS
jgi:hypothetical protein